ncbi:MAG TPA: protein kinase, partial [Thermodesulfobacteriota bacterium]|nr:protein kinase [Thermodesulfobacteriota bacterium]
MTTPGGDLIGKEIDQFRIDEFIGQGAMGVVYKAFDKILHRPVALKLIPKTQGVVSLSMAEARKRLIQEAQAAGCLSHPNIVTIHSYGETDEFQYICMEYIVGQTLGEILAEKKFLSVNEAIY